MHGNLDLALGREAAEDATRRVQAAALRSDRLDARWYVANSGTGHDAKTEDVLKREGFEFYYPRMTVIRYKPRDRMSQRQRRAGFPIAEKKSIPLFPRYFFVFLDLGVRGWHDTFERAGLHGIISHTGRPLPAPIATAVILALKARESDGGITAAVETQQFMFEVGEEVRISAGVFCGFNAVVQNIPQGPVDALDESARIKLLVSLFGRLSVVQMSVTDIEKL